MQPGAKHLVAVLALTATLSILAAACGGAASTPTPTPVPATPTPVPATPAPALAAPTPAPATPTRAAVAATPTATAVPATPTPAGPQPKRGGILSIAVLANQPSTLDLYEAIGTGSAHEALQPMFNNIIRVDTYSPDFALEGEAAERWQFAQDGKAFSIQVRRGIQFHDGSPLTARDVAYAFQRTIKPAPGKVMGYGNFLQVVQAVETPDDYTVRLTLSRPSNAFLAVLSSNTYVVYPAHLPFPEQEKEYARAPIGSGPFVLKSFAVGGGVPLRFVRNDNYWKKGLPYLDGISSIPMGEETNIAAWRAGKLDATAFDSFRINPERRDQLIKDYGFQPKQIVEGPIHLHFNQRSPWTDRRAREAVSLALDRRAVVVAYRQGLGEPAASPLLSPELGGEFGIPIAEMSKRPGFRPEKAADVARAKALLAEAGVDPGRTTVTIVASILAFQVPGLVLEDALRTLGFKTNLASLSTFEERQRLQRGDFDVNIGSSSVFYNDPMALLGSWALSNGASNSGKWSDPELERLIAQQDETLDLAERKRLLTRIQLKMLDEHFGSVIPIMIRFSIAGNMPWLKDYYSHIRFLHDHRFRWERVWLDR